MVYGILGSTLGFPILWKASNQIACRRVSGVARTGRPCLDCSRGLGLGFRA